MRLIPADIIGGWYADTALSWAAMRTVNWLPESAEVAGTRTVKKLATPPGLRAVVNLGTGAPIRGLEDVEGTLFAVSGDSLFEIATDFSFTNRGNIPGVSRVSMAHNKQGGATAANELAIANGLSGYVYNTATQTLVQITDSGFEGASTFDYVDGFMSFTDPQGRFWGHSDLNQATQYSTLDRNDAESAPDKILSHIVSHREVIVWGPRTGEFFRNTGAATGTFQRVDGTEMEVGICSTFARARVDNTVCWVGHDLTVYRLNGHSPQRISTRPIEQLLATVNPDNIFCTTWEDRGHKVFYITSPGNFTIGFDFASGLWHARESYGLNQWRINALVRWNGLWVAGDYTNGLLYALDWNVYTENGQPMVSEAATGYTAADQNTVLAPYAELIFDTGGDEGTQPEPLTITGDLPNGFVGDTGTMQYVVSGGFPPYGPITLASGSLPPGATMDADGLVTYEYLLSGSYAWQPTVTDSLESSASVSDTASVQSLPWIGSGLSGTSDEIVPSSNGLIWTGPGWDVPNYNGGFLVRRSSDGATIAYNAIAFSFKFGISFNNGLTFAMFNTVGMNATGHVVGWSGGFWHCSSSSSATRITDGGVQSTVASATGFNTMCIATNRVIGFKGTRIWHADVTGDNWVDTLPMPIGSLLSTTFRAKAVDGVVVMAAYEDLGATLALHVVWSANNGDSFTDTTPLTIADPGATTTPFVWHDDLLGLWAVTIHNRVIFGPSPGSLAASAFVFPSAVNSIGSDGEKFVFACLNHIVATSDFVTFTTVHNQGAVSVLALT